MNKKEALEIVRKNYPHVGFSGSEFETALRELVPELAESKDERIRKTIGLILIATEEDQDAFYRTHNLTRKECTAWLEKQKEQNPLSTEETELNSIAFLEQMGYTCIPPGKELKHYTYEQSKQAAEDCYYSKGYNTEDGGRCNEQSFLWGFEEGVDWCEQQKEQKLAEKHTEYPLTPDECIKPTEVHEPSNDELQRHQDELFDFKAFVAKQASEHNILFVRNSDWDNFCTELLSYFNKKQKPAGWSEEEMRKIVELKYFITQCNGFNKENRKKAFDMIDAFRSRPHWKPSEEQMDALENAWLECDSKETSVVLSSLMSDLQKLL